MQTLCVIQQILLCVHVHVAWNAVVGALEDEIGRTEAERSLLGDRQRCQRLSQLLLRCELWSQRQAVGVLAAVELCRRFKVGLGRSSERCR